MTRAQKESGLLFTLGFFPQGLTLWEMSYEPVVVCTAGCEGTSPTGSGCRLRGFRRGIHILGSHLFLNQLNFLPLIRKVMFAYNSEISIPYQGRKGQRVWPSPELNGHVHFSADMVFLLKAILCGPCLLRLLGLSGKLALVWGKSGGSR